MGGLAFDTKQIGVALSAASVGLIVGSLWIVPKIIARWGLLYCYRWFGCLAMVPVLMGTPTLLTYLNDSPSPVLWTGLMVLLYTKCLVSLCGFTASILLVNNSVPNQRLGRAN